MDRRVIRAKRKIWDRIRRDTESIGRSASGAFERREKYGTAFNVTTNRISNQRAGEDFADCVEIARGAEIEAEMKASLVAFLHDFSRAARRNVAKPKHWPASFRRLALSMMGSAKQGHSASAAESEGLHTR